MRHREIESAYAIEVGKCENCNHPHLVFLDENDEPYADAVINEVTGPPLIKQLQELLYELAVNKGDQ